MRVACIFSARSWEMKNEEFGWRLRFAGLGLRGVFYTPLSPLKKEKMVEFVVFI